MEWLNNFNKAIDYIEDNLKGNISYENAAKVACCSTYYFQRIFSYIIGISLSEYIRRRKMSMAALDLHTTDLKIIDIAFKYGYKSPTAFNRAFKSIHGISPIHARNGKTFLNSYPRINFTISITGNSNMKYKIEKKNSIKITGLRTKISSDIEQNFKIVPEFWKNTLKSEYFPLICNLKENDIKGILGISVYNNQDDIYYYIAKSSDNFLHKEFYQFEIPPATWVIFECIGNLPESIQNAFKYFYKEWLPFSGYKYAQLPDIEVYSQNPEKINHSELWIAIKK